MVKKKRSFSKGIVILIVATFILNLFAPVKSVQAADLPILGAIEAPLDNTNSTGSIYLKGWALSSVGIDTVKVYINGNYYANANYGSQREDIYSKYLQYNEHNSGFNLPLTGMNNGANIVKVVITDKGGKTLEQTTNVSVNVNQKTAIMGSSSLDPLRMKTFLYKNNTSKTWSYIDSFVDTLVSEAKTEGVRYDVLFAQIMNETNFLKFGGDVQESQNNFAGLGASGGGNPGESFPDIKTGLRAVVQHLKAYASSGSLVNTCVDPRFQYVTRQSAVYVEHLGINENPTGKGWAAAKNYGYSIYNLMQSIASTEPMVPLDVSFTYGGKTYGGHYFNVGDSITIKATASRSNIVYSYYYKDNLTGKYTNLVANSTSSTYTWKPTAESNYMFGVVATDNVTGEVKATYINGIVIGDSSPLNASFTYGGQKYGGNYFKVGDSVTLQAQSSRSNVVYTYYVKDNATGKYTNLVSDSTSPTYNWQPTVASNYMIGLIVKDKITGDQKTYYINGITIENNAPLSVSFTYGGQKYGGSYFNVGDSITIKATANRSNVVYSYYYKDNLTGKYTSLVANSTSSTYTWKPTVESNYMFGVVATDSVTGEVKAAYINGIIIGNNAPMNVSFTYGDKTYGGHYFNIGDSITIKASANRDNVVYSYYYKDNLSGKYTNLVANSTSSTYTWKPTVESNYMFGVIATDKVTGEVKAAYINGIVIGDSAPLSISFTYGGQKYGGSYFKSGDSIMLQAQSSRSNVVYTYYLRDNSTGKYTSLVSNSKSATYTWAPSGTSTYMIGLVVTDSITGEAKSYSIDGIIIGRNKLIVIDPGHNFGGDYGAESTIDGVTYSETELNMQVAVKLQSKLLSMGYDVVMTRQPWETPTDDYTTSLNKRSALANNLKADLFISLHHNSNDSSLPNGISTYYSTYKPGLKDVQADLIPLTSGYDGWTDTKPTSAGILSRDFAKNVEESLTTKCGYAKSGDDSGRLGYIDRNLSVTVKTNMPSVLIELGFISNASEAVRCANQTEQQNKANVIADEVGKMF